VLYSIAMKIFVIQNVLYSIALKNK